MCDKYAWGPHIQMELFFFSKKELIFRYDAIKTMAVSIQFNI